MLHRLLLAGVASVVLASIANAQPTLSATSDAHPGDTITWSVSSGTANDRVMVLASLRSDGATLGPITTRCGTLQVTLAIGPGFRTVGHGRIAADGSFSSSVTVPQRLPARFDGLVLHAQALTAHVTVTPNPPNPPTCSIATSTSNVADTTIHVP
ncbi:MAG: hypothetical protein HYR85_07510 [Planctomycetes bacterium]|nr:hypothetical protein [Planctomycetota bacterium]MBI3848055.1 hypothetical protein [Planctomycetota bacterium]